ncbi:MAG: epimerase [Planctomycetota bacterium]|nr:MAG: epimerase [Planctomycetota bacterium]
MLKQPVLITGASGFLGTALARRLVRDGHRVLGLVRSTSSPRTRAWLQELGVQLVEGDVATGAGLAEACSRVELVVHSAAVIGYRRRLVGAMQRTNVLGTRHVVRACLAAGVQRLVHVSSIAAIGLSDTPRLLDEDAPYNAGVLDAAYFDTKHAAELEVQAGVSRGLQATIVNPGAIYGPSATPSNSSRIIEQIVRGQVPFAPTGGINVVALDTVVDGVVAALAHGRPGRRYVLGGENLSLAQLIERVSVAAGTPHSPRALPTWWRGPLRAAMTLVEPFVPDRVWITPDMCGCFGRWLWFDTARAERELGVVPHDLDRCFRDTIAQLRRDGRLPAA